MDIQDLKIKNIEPIEQINPTGGSGTGYCQYTKIKVTYENDETQIINISNWYTSKKVQIEEFKNATSQMLLKGFNVLNNQETIDMLLKILHNN